MADDAKPAKAETLEVEIVRGYWAAGEVTAIRGSDAVTVPEGEGLKPGDVVSLPKKAAAGLVNAGAAKLTD